MSNSWGMAYCCLCCIFSPAAGSCSGWGTAARPAAALQVATLEDIQNATWHPCCKKYITACTVDCATAMHSRSASGRPSCCCHRCLPLAPAPLTVLGTFSYRAAPCRTPLSAWLAPCSEPALSPRKCATGLASRAASRLKGRRTLSAFFHLFLPLLQAASTPGGGAAGVLRGWTITWMYSIDQDVDICRNRAPF